MPAAVNAVHYGEDPDIVSRYVRHETVDLIYVDPPFRSNQDYKGLFQEQDRSPSTA